ADFRLQLSAASAQPISVSFATVNGTAVAPQDYVATNGQAILVPGQNSQLLPVWIHGDRLNESTETFVVMLSDAFNATIVDGSGLCRIVDDDPLPTVTLAGAILRNESCTPTNSAIDPGETIAMNFILRNTSTGGAAASNLW